MMPNLLFNLLLCWAAAAAVMLWLWQRQRRTRNAGTVDVAWGLLTGAAAAALVLTLPAGVAERKWLLAAMALVWGLRLGVLLWRRVAGKPEDSRYRYLREASGARANLVMFVFFQIQALWVILFALPYLAAALSPRSLGLVDLIGVAIWLVAIGGVTVADGQLARFKTAHQQDNAVCDIGLWRLSRHPNYFFEWLGWWAFVFIGSGSPWWWLTAAGVVVMYVFLNHITGIPHTERQSLRRRGEAYRRYQQTTRPFFPWPKKP